MDTIDTVARIGIEKKDLKNIPEGGMPLVSAYVIDPAAVIKAAEDFTISINTVSRSLLDKYRDHYRAGGRDRNDYFTLFSRFGLGDAAKPTLRVHLLEKIQDKGEDWTTIWAENIEMIEDYRTERGDQRLYLGFDSFCQSLENDEGFGSVDKTLKQIMTDAGSVLPILAPFLTVGKVAVDGIDRLLRKKIKIESEIKKAEFAWYPADAEGDAIPGHAPLQTGAYAFFFEKTDFSALRLQRNGTISNAQSPYILVNVERGRLLAPEQLDVAAGARLMEKFQTNYGYPLSENAMAKHGSLDAISEIGRSYRLAQQVTRYFTLKDKKEGELTPEEKRKMEQLGEILEKEIPGFNSTVA